MKKYLCLFAILAGCANKVEVPAQVATTQCIKDAEGKCTANFEVRHVIAIELPTVLTDSCKAEWNAVDYPDKEVRDAGYNQCITDYINSLLELIKGIGPTDLTLPNQ
jgi:hypothetical protein